jgi:phospholipid:diacylglycerol acyltransferase
MHMASYDWRLSFRALEERDQYFSRLKSSLELSKKQFGKKAVLVAHSMGANVLHYFFKWVESPIGGNGGKHWVDDHVESFINIGGPLLGVPKSLSALVSGEMKDTAYLNALISYIVEQMLSKADRLEVLRTYGAMGLLLPKGGDPIWSVTRKDKAMISFLMESHKDLDEKRVMDIIKNTSIPLFKSMLEKEYRFGLDPVGVRDETIDQSTWTNVLESSLPEFRENSTFKIYCLYGYGEDTEVKYYYTPSNPDDTVQDAFNYTDFQPPFIIHSEYNSEQDNVYNGIMNGPGYVFMIAKGAHY